ncbi:hypothetical protein ACIPYQ_40085 [Streptomyces sp. NPDC090045]|uniref:hypothetical protein n=1 Tax=Streptomyces sp. NPDC090045 TaxID=3365927 RepID=UPI003809663C
MRQERDEGYGPGSPDYGLSYEPDPRTVRTEEYGLGSPDSGLSYEPDPWADPVPDENPDYRFREEFTKDDAESMWEAAFREGQITREQFQNRRRGGAVPESGEAPDAQPAIRSAVEKLRAKLAGPGLSPEQRALDEQALSSLEEMLDKKPTDRPDSSASS